MFFFNLSLFEFLAVFGAVSGLVVTLYLLSRAKRRQSVATLRFWRNAAQTVASTQRRHIQQPWSLVLQLLGLALLLLAIAQLRLGSPENGARDHVLVLDTSAVMATRSANGTWLNEAKRQALRYVRSLPSYDRVMLVRADGLATPATKLEDSRDLLLKTIANSRPGASALDLQQALQFAGQVQKLHANRPGEIVLIGAGYVSSGASPLPSPAGVPLRFLSVGSATDNVGLKRVGLRRSLKEPDLWEVFVSVKNYGNVLRSVPIALLFGGAPVGTRRLQVVPGDPQEFTFQFRTRAAGWLETRLLRTDSFSEDNRVILELPGAKPVPVVVYTNEPQLLRPVLSASPELQAEYRAPAAYQPAADGVIVVFDRFRPKDMPKGGSIWIEPPAASSPVKVRTVTQNAPLTEWRATHPLGAGLRSKQIRLESAQVFAPGPRDVAIAKVEGGPVMVARETGPRMVLLGFHPGRSSLRYDLATPLLFANILRWLSPDAFRASELIAGTVGSVKVAVDEAAEPSGITVLSETGQQLPFTLQGRNLRFFAGAPGTVRVRGQAGEQVHSLTLPEVGDRVWEPPASVRRGLPGRRGELVTRDVWPLLALLGMLVLLAEWLLFGRSRTQARQGKPAATSPELRKAS